eukprot:m.161714 g.161714  ORF g.161714 m.161714 type:complete len:226 (+) comp17072_c1_seq1:290-967(+)
MVDRFYQHTLLRDRGDKIAKEKEKDRPKSPVFVLDGVRVAAKAEAEARIGAGLEKHTARVYAQPRRSKEAEQLMEKVHSQGYTTAAYAPQRGTKLEKEAPAQAIVVRRKSVLDEYLEDPPKSAQEFATYNLPPCEETDRLRAKAESAYSPKKYSPAKGERRPSSSTASPASSPMKFGSRTSYKSLDELPPAPKNNHSSVSSRTNSKRTSVNNSVVSTADSSLVTV